MSLAERIKKTRKMLGLTQKAIASKINSSEQVWRAYESGKSTPGGNVLSRLADLGVNINWLLSGYGQWKVERGERRKKVGFQPDELDANVIQAFLEITLESGNLKKEDCKKNAHFAVDVMSLIADVRGDNLPTVEQIKSIVHALGAFNNMSLGNDYSLKELAEVIKLIIKTEE